MIVLRDYEVTTTSYSSGSAVTETKRMRYHGDLGFVSKERFDKFHPQPGDLHLLQAEEYQSGFEFEHVDAVEMFGLSVTLMYRGHYFAMPRIGNGQTWI